MICLGSYHGNIDDLILRIVRRRKILNLLCVRQDTLHVYFFSHFKVYQYFSRTHQWVERHNAKHLEAQSNHTFDVFQYANWYMGPSQIVGSKFIFLENSYYTHIYIIPLREIQSCSNSSSKSWHALYRLTSRRRFQRCHFLEDYIASEKADNL